LEIYLLIDVLKNNMDAKTPIVIQKLKK